LLICCIQQANALDIIDTVVGTGTGGYSGDGGDALSANIASPKGIFYDASGNLFIADSGNYRIRKIDVATNIISTVAGNGVGTFAGDGGLATSASLWVPVDIHVDSVGNIYIADRDNHRIRKVDQATGVINTVVGSGPTGLGSGSFSGDGGLATSARLNSPSGVFVDSSGNIFIADNGNHRIRKVDASTGNIATVVGNGTTLGDGGPAVSAACYNPTDLFIDTAGNIYIADTNHHHIRKVDAATGIINTIAGSGTTSGFSGDDGPATSAKLNSPVDVIVDVTGNIIFVDGGNFRIRKIDASTGIITTLAGNGKSAFSGDGGPATNAGIFTHSISLNPSNELGISDFGNQRIRQIQSSGVLQFSIGAYVIAEDSGSISIPVSRTGGSNGLVTVDYATSDITAVAGADYNNTFGTLTFPNNDATNKTFVIPITNDIFQEDDEDIRLTLSNPTGGATLGTPSTATLTIVDDDIARLALSSAAYAVNENGDLVSITVTRTGRSSGVVSVDYATSDGSATDGADYIATTGTITFGDGDTADKSFTIPVLDDDLLEGIETFDLILNNPVGGTILVDPSTATLTINDDETASIILSSSTLTFSTTVHNGNPAPQSLTLSGSGATLNWSSASDASWLSVTPSSGTLISGTDQLLNISVNVTSLLSGPYSGKITIDAPGATNTPQIIHVNLAYSDPPGVSDNGSDNGDGSGGGGSSSGGGCFILTLVKR